MRVLITGVAGFLGSHLADALLAAGHEVVGVDNLIGGYRDNVPAGVCFTEADCGDFEATRALASGCEVVYHLAAIAHEGLSVFSPAENARHGYAASASVFSAATAAGARRVVFASSMARYGAQEAPFHERQRPAPEDPYGLGKVAAEDLLKLLGRVHGVEWVVAVPHNIIGPRQRYTDPYRNVVAIFINLMLQGRQPIIYGDGGQRRSFTFVSDCVDPLVRMATADVAGEVINVGPDDEVVTILELARAVARIVGVELRPIHVPERPQEVRVATCSADKARQLLAYAPRVRLEDGLREMVAWVRARGARPFDYHLGIEIHSDKTPRTWTERMF